MSLIIWFYSVNYIDHHNSMLMRVKIIYVLISIILTKVNTVCVKL